MTLHKANTALLTANLAAAERRHTERLGRRPDTRPMDMPRRWDRSDQGGLKLSSSEARNPEGNRIASATSPLRPFPLA